VTRHFTALDWVEFGRKTVNVHLRREMEAHLSDGCADCTKSAELWELVSGIGARELELTPPLAAVRSAQALGSFFSRERFRPSTVLVDTWSTAVAGLR
jgi:hypothetical protein